MNRSFHLAPVTSADVDEVHALFGDPATWRHLPSGRCTDAEQTAAMVAVFEREWAAEGLSQWIVRAAEAWDGVAVGDVIGMAGVAPRHGSWWNVGYRFTPRAWGRGLAVLVTAEAVARALELRPAWPVVSRLLSSNPASERVSRRLGLEQRWRGPSTADPDVDRLVLADRELDPELLASIVALG